LRTFNFSTGNLRLFSLLHQRLNYLRQQLVIQMCYYFKLYLTEMLGSEKKG